jgi:hypothetical protein
MLSACGLVISHHKHYECVYACTCVYEKVNWFASEVLHVVSPYLYNLQGYHVTE